LRDVGISLQHVGLYGARHFSTLEGASDIFSFSSLTPEKKPMSTKRKIAFKRHRSKRAKQAVVTPTATSATPSSSFLPLDAQHVARVPFIMQCIAQSSREEKHLICLNLIRELGTPDDPNGLVEALSSNDSMLTFLSTMQVHSPRSAAAAPVTAYSTPKRRYISKRWEAFAKTLIDLPPQDADIARIQKELEAEKEKKQTGLSYSSLKSIPLYLTNSNRLNLANKVREILKKQFSKQVEQG
jgi:hypothetical protein